MYTLFKRSVGILGLWLISIAPDLAEAQARNGKLVVTVVDQTGGVLPSALVTIVGLEDVTRRTTVEPVHATDKGLATFDNIAPGRYSIAVEFPGFNNGGIKDVRIRAGENKQTITLSLSTLSDVATASLDRQDVASDRQGTFGNALTREQIDALSDNRDELQRQIQDLAGPDATIVVDSFEGRELPPKSQIKSIRISRDQFAPEMHSAGGVRIEIVTQPGIGPLRGNIGGNFYDSATDGRNPIVGATPKGQDRGINLGLNGTLLKNRMSFALYGFGNRSYTSPVLNARLQSGATDKRVLDTRDASNYGYISSQLDYALTKDQTLRMSLYRNMQSSTSGTGGFNLPERAVKNDSNSTQFYLQEIGPLGRRFATNTRFSFSSQTRTATSAVEAPTVIVLDEFTSGGAQQRGVIRNKSVNLASDLDYVRGLHSVRMGTEVGVWHYIDGQTSNYLGTYTFAGLDEYNAGTPMSYTRRVGDPSVQYWNATTALYIQDDYKVRKNFTITGGLRYEAQTHVKDRTNFGPRFGVTWAPFKSGATTLRFSAGTFFDWFAIGGYATSLRVNGTQQMDINLRNPSYPDPGVATGPAVASDRYLYADNFTLARNSRASFGLTQRVSAKLNFGFTYAYVRGSHLLVGENLNAPVGGVRPDASFANVIRADDLGSLRSHSLATNFTLNLAGAPTGPNAGKGPLFVWTRGLRIGGNYNLGRSMNNTDGAFVVPATGSLDQEWGPAAGDVRHRGSVSFGTSALRNLNASLNVFASSAPPITIRTGVDNNGDLIFNDRPAGVGRNSARTSGQYSSSASFTYNFNLGSRTVNSGGGVQISSVNGVLSASQVAAQSTPRYNLYINANIQNLTNHANYGGYSGVMTSGFFLRPTSAEGVRRIRVSLGMSF